MIPDYFGSDGGRLASAFAAGCVATFAFMTSVGGFMWKMIGRDRIKELSDQLAAERLARQEDKRHCQEMEARLVDRIQQLETILLFETVGGLRQDAAKAFAELHERYRGKIGGDGE